MMKLENSDPRTVLGVSDQAGAEEIRAAYLDAVKRNPPDRHPEAFERIRDAYQALRDPKRRVQSVLFAEDAQAALADWLDAQKKKRGFVGPGPWLDALRKT
ncbi:MAG: DnaJ domain-containing protein [Vicinamibacteria bacterium]